MVNLHRRSMFQAGSKSQVEEEEAPQPAQSAPPPPPEPADPVMDDMMDEWQRIQRSASLMARVCTPQNTVASLGCGIRRLGG